MSNKDYLKHLGMELRVARIRKGLLMRHVARMTGFHVNAISQIERGAFDSGILTYKKIAEAVGVSLKDFV